MAIRTSADRHKTAGKPICKVAITGGGCAGKTTFLAIAKRVAEERGWTVLTVPETPTLVMENGIGPMGRVPFLEFERAILSLQIAWEETVEHVADTMDGSSPVLILCDRGMPEIAAYMGYDQYDQILSDAGLTREASKETYDAAIHLVSVADGASELYSAETNEHRYETPEVALQQEMRIRECWEGYDRRTIIPADAGSFETKMRKATQALNGILDETRRSWQGR
jgi:predicted ATPase